MFDVITIGGATRDIIFVTNLARLIKGKRLTEQMLLGFEYGAKIKGNVVYFALGGGANNVSVGLSRLGLKTAACACVGKDTDGLNIWGNLEAEKVDTILVQQSENLRTGFSFIVTHKKSREHVIFAFTGANQELKLVHPPKFSEGKLGRAGYNPQIADTKWMYVTSLAGRWQKNLAEIVKIVKENNINLGFNPGVKQLKTGWKGLKKILEVTKILALNQDEAIELVLSHENLSSQEPKNLIKTLLGWGPKIVIVTQGKDGAYVGDKESIYHSPASSPERVDTTGAGDSFGSGFLGGYIATGDIKEALKWGIANSGNVVGFYGAQEKLLTKKETKKKIKEIEIKSI